MPPPPRGSKALAAVVAWRLGPTSRRIADLAPLRKQRARSQMSYCCLRFTVSLRPLANTAIVPSS